MINIGYWIEYIFIISLWICGIPILFILFKDSLVEFLKQIVDLKQKYYKQKDNKKGETK